MGAISCILLGPQRLKPTLIEAVRSLGISGGIATVTAGWQEREDDDQELRDHLEGRALNLRLYHRTEEIFAEDPDLAHAHRERQDRLRQLQELYILRLGFAREAAYELLRHPAGGDIVEEQREAALEAVRQLDARHLERVRGVHLEFEARWKPWDRLAMIRHRDDLYRIMEGAGVLAIAGGHVAILLNRLRLFGVEKLLGAKPIIAWSAGAMAVSEVVVLYHDNPPQGKGRTEVLENGLGLAPGIVALPHARHRLQLGDRIRATYFARRFPFHHCCPMDEGARFDWDGQRWLAPWGGSALSRNGDLQGMPAA